MENFRDWEKYEDRSWVIGYPQFKIRSYKRGFNNPTTSEKDICYIHVLDYLENMKQNYIVKFEMGYLLGECSIFCLTDKEFLEKFEIIFGSLNFIS